MNQVNQVKDKAQKMTKLLEDEIFNEIIIEDFIKGGILENSINGNIDNSKTQDELKARQILHKYLFELIRYAEVIEK